MPRKQSVEELQARIAELETLIPQIDAAIVKAQKQMAEAWAATAPQREEVRSFWPTYPEGTIVPSVGVYVVPLNTGPGSEGFRHDEACARLDAAMMPYNMAKERWNKLRFEQTQHGLWLDLTKQKLREQTAIDNRLKDLLGT